MSFPPLDGLTPPIVAIIGGDRPADRMDLLKSLAGGVKYLVIGGTLARSFLAAKGLPVSSDKTEPGLVAHAREIIDVARGAGCELVVPKDLVVTAPPGSRAHTVPVARLAPDHIFHDLGTDTNGDIARCIEGAKSLLWHGPLGACETPPFDNATLIVARHAAMLARAGRLDCHFSGASLATILDQAGLAAIGR